MAGCSLTGAVDTLASGEGLITLFREQQEKPGMQQAVSDGFAPLRWCLFVEPVNVYRGTSVELDVVLANEDVLDPCDYTVNIEVFGPGDVRVAHGPNEYVPIGDLEATVRTLALTILRFVGYRD